MVGCICSPFFFGFFFVYAALLKYVLTPKLVTAAMCRKKKYWLIVSIFIALWSEYYNRRVARIGFPIVQLRPIKWWVSIYWEWRFVLKQQVAGSLRCQNRNMYFGRLKQSNWNNFKIDRIDIDDVVSTTKRCFVVVVWSQHFAELFWLLSRSWGDNTSDNERDQNQLLWSGWFICGHILPL